jgi:hypothetical protein
VNGKKENPVNPPRQRIVKTIVDLMAAVASIGGAASTASAAMNAPGEAKLEDVARPYFTDMTDVIMLWICFAGFRRGKRPYDSDKSTTNSVFVGGHSTYVQIDPA